MKTLVFAGVAIFDYFLSVFYPPSKISFIVSCWGGGGARIQILVYCTIQSWRFIEPKLNWLFFISSCLGFSNFAQFPSVARIPILTTEARPDHFFGGKYGA